MDDYNDERIYKAELMQQQLKYQSRNSYEVARFILYFLINIQGKTLKRNLKRIQDVYQFDWEKERRRKSQNIDEMKSMFTVIKAAFKNNPKREKKKN